MNARNYWLDLFSPTTWQEFCDAGALVSGFHKRWWKNVQQIKPGDYLLCYVTGISRWVGVLEVVSKPFQDNTQIWKDKVYPCRVQVRVVVQLTLETAVPIHEHLKQLSIYNKGNPNAWNGSLRSSPRKWMVSDGEVVVEAVREAQRNPVSRPVNRRSAIPRHTKMGSVTVPGINESIELDLDDLGVDLTAPEIGESVERGDVSSVEASETPRLHTEIQWLLLKLGNDMSLDVWVASNDRSQGVNGHKFTDLPHLKKELPLQFDSAATQIIKLIDVLWLKGNAIVAAFESECTTSIYSGLLRMADLISIQPNLKIPLYLVAPDERRVKVITEVNRPTFSRLSPPMNQICRFISIPTLRERIKEVSSFIRHLSPEFLVDLSQSCRIEDL